MDARAQEEIRTYADVIGNQIVSVWCPFTWEAFVDYRLQGLALSKFESRVIGAIANNDKTLALEVARTAGWLSGYPDTLKRNREREECELKLLTLNLAVPWRN
jgi:thymidylate synthase (FAD)